jgi:hypothetical protein
MVNVMLTESMINTGAALIKKLDERGASPDAAFWIYFPDIQQWKLMLAEVKLGEIGPKEFYKKIQDTISASKSEIGELSLDDIALSKPESPIVALLRTAIRTGPGINGIRFTNNVINGTVIEDAYIYRLS